MTKVKICKNYVLVYNLEKCETGFLISIEKNGAAVSERSGYIIQGVIDDMRDLLCRLHLCAVTPMSLSCILEDEGYISAPPSEDESLN